MLTITVGQALKEAEEKLRNKTQDKNIDIDIDIDTKREAEYLLSFILKCNSSKLMAFPEWVLTKNEQASFEEILTRRMIGEPLAYIKKSKSFWNIDLEVDSSVLIPRSETELLIETILSLNILNFNPNLNLKILDLGTGSGAIAITLAHNQPDWTVFATDLSYLALEMAKKNAQKYALNNIQFYQGAWYQAISSLEQSFDLIVSNPPYISPNSDYLASGDLRFEPRQALVSENNGLKDLQHIIENAKSYLCQNGYLLVEHGYDQAEALQDMFRKNKFSEVKTLKDIQGQDRVTYGKNTE